MKVYKLVRRERDKLISLFAPGKAKVQYKPHEWTEAPEWLAKNGYYLTAFKDAKDAKVYDQIGDYELWEAEAESIVQRLPHYADSVGLFEGKIIPLGTELWPDGTVMAKRICLTKLIEKGGRYNERNKD